MAERLNPNSHLRNLLVTPEVINYTEDITIQSRLIIGGSALSLASEISSLTIDTVRTGDIHDTSKELISALSTQERSLSTDMTSWIEGVKNYIQSVSNDERSKQILLRLGINVSGFNNEDALAFYDKFCNNDQFANIDTFVNSVIESYRNESYSVLAQDLPKLQEIANIYGSEASNFIIQRISIKKKLEDEEGKKRFIEVANEKDENGKLKINIFNTQQENFLNPLVAITEKINIPSLPKQDVVGENNVQEEQPVPIKPTSFFNRLKSSVANAQLSRKELREKKRLAKETARDDAQKKLLSRRGFIVGGLKFAGAVALAAATKISTDAEARTGIEAGLSRIGSPIEDKLNTEMKWPSEALYRELWEKHFSGKEDLMPLIAWSREGGFGQGLAGLANIYYDANKEGTEDFDSYFKKFIERMHETADLAQLDFITLASILRISADNMGGFEGIASDRKISFVQNAIVPSTDSLGALNLLLNTIEPGGLMNGKANIPEKGMNIYDVVRLVGEPTTGMMDFEPSERAKGYKHANAEVREVLKKNYPEVAYAYENIYEQQQKVQDVRNIIKESVKKYISRFSEKLKAFGEGDEKALEALGIGQEIDQWQLFNYTTVWLEYTKTPYDVYSLRSRVVESMKKEYQENPEEFSSQLFSQQLRNPKFLNFLLSNAETPEERESLTSMQDLVEEVENESSDLRVRINKALTAEGKLEFDEKFQIVTTVMIKKMLNDLARTEHYNPSDKNSLYWHIFRSTIIREITPPYISVHGTKFMRDAKIDSPYDPEGLLLKMDEFIAYIKKLGLIEKDPNEDFDTFSKVLSRFREQNLDQLYESFPEMPKKQVKALSEYVNKYISGRLYVNYSDEYDSVMDIPHMHEFANLLLKEEIINLSPDKDVVNLYTVLNAFYRETPLLSFISPELKDYFNTYLKSEVSKIKADWMYFLWAEYPPIYQGNRIISILTAKPEDPIVPPVCSTPGRSSYGAPQSYVYGK